MNRIIEIQRRAAVRDSFGGEIVSWPSLATVWADAKITGTSERFKNDAKRRIPLRNATFTVNFIDGVREDSRVIYRGMIWDIKGIKVIGRRRKLDLICQTDASRKYQP